MMEELTAALAEAETDDVVRAVVISGEGRACVGLAKTGFIRAMLSLSRRRPTTFREGSEHETGRCWTADCF